MRITFFLRLHESACTRWFRSQRPCPSFPAIKAHGARATSYNIVHHLEEKLRRLELDMLVVATFSVALVDLQQLRIPSPWLDPIPQAFYISTRNIFGAFCFASELPGSFHERQLSSAFDDPLHQTEDKFLTAHEVRQQRPERQTYFVIPCRALFDSCSSRLSVSSSSNQSP